MKKKRGVPELLDFTIAIKILWAFVNKCFIKGEGRSLCRMGRWHTDRILCLPVRTGRGFWNHAKVSIERSCHGVWWFFLPSVVFFRQECLCPLGQWLISVLLVKQFEDLRKDEVSRWLVHRASGMMCAFGSVRERDPPPSGISVPESSCMFYHGYRWNDPKVSVLM